MLGSNMLKILEVTISGEPVWHHEYLGTTDMDVG